MKILIIRFGSFGDIVQAMSVVDDLVAQGVRVEWVVKKKFAPVVELNPNIAKVWPLDTTLGWKGLWQMGKTLRQQKYQFIYDAHSNIRSFILRTILSPLLYIPVLRRSKERFRRILLFYFRKNTFPRPFRGMVSFRRPLAKVFPMPESIPLQKWNFNLKIGHKSWPEGVVLCPGGNWPMKRWPIGHWISLIRELPHLLFTILGGEEDSFCQELMETAPDRVINLAGKLTLAQSCYILSRAKLAISADTGFLHVADLLGVRSIGLLGPTAFGHPTRESTTVLEHPLPCRPCTKDGRGRCSQETWQKCMVEIFSGQGGKRGGERSKQFVLKVQVWQDRKRI